MSAEKILKKSFIGGFRKKDVIDYVEKLQNENSELAKDLDSNKVNKEKIDLYENKNSELSAVVDALEEEKASLQAELRELKLNNVSLLEQNADLSLKIEEMSSAINEKDDRLISAYDEKDKELAALADKKELEISELREKCAELEASVEKISQDKANTLIQDAISYSDKLVSAAKETAEKYIGEAGDNVSAASEQVVQANERLKTARLNFDYSLDSIRDNLDTLINSLDELKKEFTIGD